MYIHCNLDLEVSTICLRERSKWQKLEFQSRPFDCKVCGMNTIRVCIPCPSTLCAFRLGAQLSYEKKLLQFL